MPNLTTDEKRFWWFVDGDRLGIVQEDSSTGKIVSPLEDIGAGMRIRFKSNYVPVYNEIDDLETHSKVKKGLHKAIVVYVKHRLFEEAGDLKQSGYYLQKFEKLCKEYSKEERLGGIIRQYFKI